MNVEDWQIHYEWAISPSLLSPFKVYWTYFPHSRYICLIQDGSFTGSQPYRTQFMAEIALLVVKEIPWMGSPNRTAGGTIFLSFPAANDSQTLKVKSVRNHSKYMLPYTNKGGKYRGSGRWRYSCSTSDIPMSYLACMNPYVFWHYPYVSDPKTSDGLEQ